MPISPRGTVSEDVGAVDSQSDGFWAGAGSDAYLGQEADRNLKYTWDTGPRKIEHTWSPTDRSMSPTIASTVITAPRPPRKRL